MFDYYDDFNRRKALKENFNSNALMLYALELRFGIDDIFDVAVDSLTDGSDDKKCDLIYIDKDLGIAVVGQAYMKKKANENIAASANKASDLNTAAAWLFAQSTTEIPSAIADRANELREGIKEGNINQVLFWYVHNCNESANTMIAQELETVQKSAQLLVNNCAGENNTVKVIAQEIGNETIEEWYEESDKRISINDYIEVDSIDKGFEIQSKKWNSYVTAVKGTWLASLLKKYKPEKLFSGNLREFLGAGKRKNKINLGMIETVNSQPENFWAFNNGVTALVNDYEIKASNKLYVTGITIINGAQTTGAIAQSHSKKEFLIPIRFIVCHDSDVIDDIINNNNKQTEVMSSDLRSNDKQQKRLRKEFEEYPNYYYSGGRRTARKTRKKDVFEPYMVAQVVEAFHGDCVIAYNEKKSLWSDDKRYVSVFTDNLHAEHIIFLYALTRAISDYKKILLEKGDNRTTVDNNNFNYLKKRGARMLLIKVIGISIECILGNDSNLDSWKLSFKKNGNFEQLVNLWKSVVIMTLTMGSKELVPVIENGGLRSIREAESAGTKIRDTISAFPEAVSMQVKDFRDNVNISAIGRR